MRSQLSHGTHHVQHAHCAARETPAPVHLVPISRGAQLGTCVPQWPGSPTRPRWGGGEKRRVQRMPRPACAMLGSVHWNCNWMCPLVHVCVCVSVHVGVSVHVCVCLYMWVCLYMCVCVCTCGCVCTCMCTVGTAYLDWPGLVGETQIIGYALCTLVSNVHLSEIYEYEYIPCYRCQHRQACIYTPVHRHLHNYRCMWTSSHSPVHVPSCVLLRSAPHDCIVASAVCELCPLRLSNSSPVTIHQLLMGPVTAGAYRMTVSSQQHGMGCGPDNACMHT